MLEEEETIINAHRKQIDESMELTRVEMQLLAGVDEAGANLFLCAHTCNVFAFPFTKACRNFCLSTQLPPFVAF